MKNLKEKIEQLKNDNAGLANGNLDGAIPFCQAYDKCSPDHNFWSCKAIKLIDGIWYNGEISWDMDDQDADKEAEYYGWESAECEFEICDEIEECEAIKLIAG